MLIVLYFSEGGNVHILSNKFLLRFISKYIIIFQVYSFQSVVFTGILNTEQQVMAVSEQQQPSIVLPSWNT